MMTRRVTFARDVEPIVGVGAEWNKRVTAMLVVKAAVD